MNISIICVGRIKESFYRDAIAEYSKRLSGYCNFRIIEVDDESDQGFNSGDASVILSREEDRFRRILGDVVGSVRIGQK